MDFGEKVVSAVLTAKEHPDLLIRLHESFGEPVDSYWNGSHTWFDEVNGTELEWRIHPVSDFHMPEGARPEELLTLALEGQVDVSHYWEGLEVFPINEILISANDLSAHIAATLGISVDACGEVDHDVIGNAYESSQGKISILSALIAQINS